jgi:enterochelin esterase-like enzyme
MKPLPILVTLLITCLGFSTLASADQASKTQDPFTFSDFDSFAITYTNTSPALRDKLIQSFITWQKQRGGFPIIEQEGEVVFFYQGVGTEQEVKLLGDFSARNFYSVAWNQTGEKMRRLVPNGPVFFVKRKFERDARLDYKFVVDGKATRDPLNNHSVVSGPGGDASELIMPDYRIPREVSRRENIPRGTVGRVNENWAQPIVKVYLPPGYNPNSTYPVIYTADGAAWADLMGLPIILDNLINDGSIKPVIAVMVDPTADRSSWYFYNPAYLQYIEKVVGYIDSHYATQAEPGGRLHIGTSAGGRISLYAGLERPDLFHNIAMLSPSLVGPPHYYGEYLNGNKRPPAHLNIWMSAGSYEGYIYQDTKMMERYFKSIDLRSSTTYTREGHSFAAWKNITVSMLQYFFSARE